MIGSYFKIAWRTIVKSKMYSIINIAGLSVGMAVAMLIGLWMYNELSFNKNFKNYDRVAQVAQNVTNNGEVQTWFSVPFPLADEIRKNYGSDFKRVVMAGGWSDHIVTVGDKKIKSHGGFFENGATEMFSLKMLRGTNKL